MTPALDLKALRELALAAIPGPWSVFKGEHGRTRRFTDVRDADGDVVCELDWFQVDHANAEHIAAFNPQTVSALLDELVALRAEQERLRERPTREHVEAAFGALSRHTVHCGDCHDTRCYGNPTYDMVLDLLQARGWITPPSDRSEP